MWETLRNKADRNCFKTPTLQEILRTRNLHQVEHCAYLEVTRLFPQVGCARSKLLFHTVQQNPKSFLLMQVYAWTEFPLLIFGFGY